MWKSIHMFIHDTSYNDKFIVEYLSPLLNELKKNKILSKYFYIRYWQGGPHIRLRYITDNEQLVISRIEGMFNNFKKTYKPINKINKDDYIKAVKNNKEGVSDIYWNEDGDLKEITYEPEIDRYGGDSVIDISESIFMESTDIVLDLLPSVRDNLTKKIIIALDLMYISLDSVTDKYNFLYNYHEFWKEFNSVNNIDEKLINTIYKSYKERLRHLSAGKYDYYDKYRKSLKKRITDINNKQTVYKDREYSSNSIVASHIHMTNNRLGLLPYYENVISAVLYKLISEEVA